MPTPNETLFVYPTQFDKLDSETIYGVMLARMIDKPVMLIDVEYLTPTLRPEAIVGIGSPTVRSIDVQNLRKEAKERLQHLKDITKVVWKKVNYEVEIGLPESRILSKVDIENPYLLVIGQHHAFNFINEWLGTFETRIAKEASCPVLIVPDKYAWHSPQHFIYVSENLVKEHQNLKWLSNLVKNKHIRITVAHITSNPEAAEFEEMTANFNSDPSPFAYRSLSPDHAERKVEELIEEKQADWLIFQKQEKSFFQRVFGKDNMEHRILKSTIPTLVL